MSLKQIFRDELTYLRHQGKEFSRQNPALSRFLSDESTDPDIERLLEGFAFLSARLRHKIEDDFPELTHSILNLLWPNYLRPFPSTTIIELAPVASAISDKQIIPKHTQFASHAVDGTQCSFRSCHNVPVYPFILESIDSTESRENTIVGINLKTLSNIPFNEIDCDHIPLYIDDDSYTAQTLYLWLFQYLDQIRVITNSGHETLLPGNSVIPAGFSSEESLLPYPDNVFDGYRVLQEYLVSPTRFHFIDITQIETACNKATADTIRLEFCFNRPLPEDIKVRNSTFKLYCTPAVNLFSHDADPVRLTGKETRYRVRPSGKYTEHYEVFTINQVSGWTDKTNSNHRGARTYKPFESFEHEKSYYQGDSSFYFHNHIQDSISNQGFDHYISFMREDETQFSPNESETISIELICSNRNLPNALAVGDICIATEDTPSFITFRNITRPTESLRPVLNESLHWQLISNMSMNYRSILKPDPLRNIIRTYDFRAMVDERARRYTQQRLAGIHEIKTSPVDHLLNGLPIRGLQSKLFLNPAGYLCEGEMYLFGTILSHFLSLFSSINSFHSLEVINTLNKEVYSWPLQKGNQPII